jgi:hypothetical protein
MTRIPDFYAREYDAPANTDSLTCPECGLRVTFEHDEIAEGEFIACGEDLVDEHGVEDGVGCGIVSRVPALPSQAGAPFADDPPTQSERS